MLSIRFTRIGRKKMPFYRIVIMDKRKDPWGKYLEKLGFYNPRTKETKLEKDRISYWLGVGAKASESVHNLFIKNGILDDKKKKSVKITKTRQAKMDKAKAEEEKKIADKKAAEEAAKAEAKKAAEAPVEAPAEEAKEEVASEETKTE